MLKSTSESIVLSCSSVRQRSTSITKQCSVILCLFAFIGCSSHIEAPRKAAADLEGSAAAGMSYIDFGQKLQALASAIALAKREGASESALRPYVEAFGMYKDSLELWKLKIQCPAEFLENGTDCTGITPQINELASKYGVPYDGEKINKAWINKNIGIPFGKQAMYPTYEVRSANRDVFQKLISTIWDKAEKKSKEG